MMSSLKRDWEFIFDFVLFNEQGSNYRLHKLSNFFEQTKINPEQLFKGKGVFSKGYACVQGDRSKTHSTQKTNFNSQRK